MTDAGGVVSAILSIAIELDTLRSRLPGQATNGLLTLSLDPDRLPLRFLALHLRLPPLHNSGAITIRNRFHEHILRDTDAS
jgi:hypothetical protein